jgi:predicted GNAT family N-acyltransferase
MTTIIDKPANIDKDLLIQLIDLVEKGDQVQRHFIERGVETADLIALLVDNREILSSATLKNPLKSYRDNVFQLAKADNFNRENLQELGYIVTNPKHEGKKLCQTLLTEFFKTIEDRQMFATTRKPSMAHILKKFDFTKLGDTYKTDLDLLIYNGKK